MAEEVEAEVRQYRQKKSQKKNSAEEVEAEEVEEHHQKKTGVGVAEEEGAELLYSDPLLQDRRKKIHRHQRKMRKSHRRHQTS